jgi:hypothetical protein
MDAAYISAIEAINSTQRDIPSTPINIGYGASLSDISNFSESLENAISKVGQKKELEPLSATMKAVAEPLDFINKEGAGISTYAESAVESGNELTPSEIVMLTARTHEFMFHCQLTSNIANRTSDGIQQLFRQQS